jgi:hypothetical protein
VQGESDAENKLMASQYYFRIKSIIQHFRKSQGYEHLPVVLGVDEHHPWVKANTAIVAAQKKLAIEDPCIAFTSKKELPKADVTHLTPEGLIEHGSVLYKAWRKLSLRAACQ